MFFSSTFVLLAATIGTQAAAIKRGYTYVCPATAPNGDALGSVNWNQGDLFYCWYGYNPDSESFNEVCEYSGETGLLVNGGSYCYTNTALSIYECPSADSNGIPLGESNYNQDSTQPYNGAFLCFYEGVENGSFGLQSYCEYAADTGALNAAGGSNEACPAAAAT